jgi:hypothetical protein
MRGLGWPGVSHTCVLTTITTMPRSLARVDRWTGPRQTHTYIPIQSHHYHHQVLRADLKELWDMDLKVNQKRKP